MSNQRQLPFSHQWFQNGLMLSTCLLCSKVAASARPDNLKIAERSHHCAANPAELKRGSAGILAQTSTSFFRVLSFGHDLALLHGRGAVLTSAGYKVTSVAALPDLVRELEKGHSDAVVLCHTLTQDEAQAALLLVKSAGLNTPVIQIFTEHPDPAFDYACRAHHPEELLTALVSISGIQRPAA